MEDASLIPKQKIVAADETVHHVVIGKHTPKVRLLDKNKRRGGPGVGGKPDEASKPGLDQWTVLEPAES